MTRRDMCHFTGKRAAMMNPIAASAAWHFLAAKVEAMGELDVPKFLNLLRAFRSASIQGIQLTRNTDVLGWYTKSKTEPPPEDYSI